MSFWDDFKLGFSDGFSDSVDKAKSFVSFIKWVMFVFSIFSFVTFSAFTLFTFIKNEEHPEFAKIMLWSLVAYGVFLAVMLVMNFLVRKSPHKMRNIKMSLTVMKSLFRFLTIVLSIIVMLSASVNNDFWGDVTQVVMILFSGWMIFVNIGFVVFRLWWAKRKKRKELEKPKPQKTRYEEGQYTLGENKENKKPKYWE